MNLQQQKKQKNMEHYCDCHHDHCHEEEGFSGNKYEQAFSKFNLHLHDEQIRATALRLVNEHKAEYDTEEVKKQLLGTLELTTLKVTDSIESVSKLVEKVNRFSEQHPELPHLASICVYPNFAGLVSEMLAVEGTEVACVCGGFPSSQTFLEVKTIETALAAADGATEIDMVMNVGAFLDGDYETCADEIREIKDAAKDCTLKVILETGALQTAANIKRAAILAMFAGADYIKTSTGKITPAATLESALVMCQTIKEYFDLTGLKIGFKAAGGINTVDDALSYYTIVREILGKDYIKEDYFRIGTSRLANLLVKELTGEEF